VLFDVRSWRVCLYKPVTVYDGRMVLAHCGIARGWDTLATTRVFGRCTLHSARRLTHRPVVPSLSFVLAWCAGRILRVPDCLHRGDLKRRRYVRWVSLIEIAMRCCHRSRRRYGSSTGRVVRPLLSRRVGANKIQTVDPPLKCRIP
jgi:hypothetical protein